MITTVCMNPSFDKTATVDKIVLGEVNRLKEVRYDIGGKGINVAIVLKRLKANAACVGCLGEADESAFLEMLAKEDVSFRFVTLPGKIRTNFKLLNQENHTVTEFNEPGMQMNLGALEQFFELLQREAKGSHYVVFSGKLPMGCEASTYQQCLQKLPEQKCVLDVEGKSLLLGIKEQPFLVKPNLPEMESIMHKELRTLRSIRDAALFLMQYGAQNVIISMGKYGAMLVSGKKAFFSPSLPVEAKSTVGAGDAMLGGVLMGLERGELLKDSFRYGVAAGAASVMTDGTQLLQAADFESLLPKVTQQEV